MHRFGQDSFATLVFGEARPHAPDLERWLDGNFPGYQSPQFAALVRS